MELALSLGSTPKPFSLLNQSKKPSFLLGSDIASDDGHGGSDQNLDGDEDEGRFSLSDPPIQLPLLPSPTVNPRNLPPSHLLRSPFPIEMVPFENGVEVNGESMAESSPNSMVSSVGMEFPMCGKRRESGEIEGDEMEKEGSSSRASDEDENIGMGIGKRKLRLTRDQSAFLEQSFKQHHNLNPRQKLALAKQLNLRPRQIEVWFQNRRARTKLKQTEVDCEYLKRCCETLTEENRRLQKELQELRALKAASQPFHMQLPATTLTMCSSCERVSASASATTTSTVSAVASAADANTILSLANPKSLPFHQAAASEFGGALFRG